MILVFTFYPGRQKVSNSAKRVEFLRQNDDIWPDMSETGLCDSLETWLAPYLNGCSRIEHLKKIDLSAALLSRLNWEEQQTLNQRAPTHYKVPSGSNIRLGLYQHQKADSKRQITGNVLGNLSHHPSTMGHVLYKSIFFHLQDDLYKLLKIWLDFGLNSYDSVKKEMKGRYPKHPWPDNPQEAMPTHKTKRHLR